MSCPLNNSKNSKYRSYKGEIGKIADNLLNREFTATKPFEKLATILEMVTDKIENRYNDNADYDVGNEYNNIACGMVRR